MSTLHRRQFVKLASSGLLIASAVPVSSALALPRPSKDKVGVALLGLGNYSTRLLAPALQATRHCELRGIITGSPEKIPEWQSKYGIPDKNTYTYGTMNDIANNDNIDVIYVVTPTGTHKDFSVMAANTGKHVWCEKPFAMDEAEKVTRKTIKPLSDLRGSSDYRANLAVGLVKRLLLSLSNKKLNLEVTRVQ